MENRTTKKELIINDKKKSYKILKKYLRNPNKYSITINIDDEDINNSIKAMQITNKDERNKFIYETVCNLLDKKWNHNFPCNFCNNRCIASRNNYMDKEYNGCCYSFDRKLFGKVKKQQCIHLKDDKSCDTKNISCKLFTCNYLRKNKIFSTKYEDYLLLRLFFNKKERLIIKYNFFRTEEEVLSKLKEKSIKPYVLYLLSLDFIYK